MALVTKGKTVIASVLTAIMAFFLTWFGVKSGPANTTQHQSRTHINQPSSVFRIPASITSAHATMHVRLLQG